MGIYAKIVVVGAGHVGSTLAYSLAASGVAREILLMDADRDRADGEAMDLNHAIPFFRPVKVTAGELADAAGAAITVITAGVAQPTGETRPALLERNLEVLRGIVPEVVRANPHGLLLMTTNPVDALTCAAQRMSGLTPARVFGTGTVLDTARLRAELAKRYSIDARNVHAYVLGEHGDSELVAWSAATIAGVPLDRFCRLTGMTCSTGEMEAIATRVRDAAYEIIRRIGATNFAIAAGLARIIETVIRNEASVLTVSTLVDGQYGIRDTCLSLPAIVDRSGIRRVLPIPLSDEELVRLRHSADVVRASLSGARFDT